MKPHPNTVKRGKQEQKGGWLPVYIEAEPAYETRETLRCYYCGFDAKGYGSGHDWACLYLVFNGKTRGKDSKIKVLVPKGGLPASNSFF